MRKLLSFLLVALIAASAIGADAATHHKIFFKPRQHVAANQFKKAPAGKQGAKLFTAAGQRGLKAPRKRVTAGGMNLYGYLFYNDAYDDFGFYALDADGKTLVFTDPVYERDEITMDNGWYADGKVCAYSLEVEYDSDFGYFPIGFFYSEIDFGTGAIITTKELDLDNGYMQISAYDSSDGYIYGFGYDFMESFGLVRAPASDPGEIELVKEMGADDICYSMTYNPIDGKIYGITVANKFVSITTGGEITEISELDSDIYDTSFPCGLVYSAGEQKFYWNPQTTDFTTGLATITPDGTVEMVQEYEDADQYTYLFTTDEAVSPETPKTPEITSIDFPDGATTGTVTFKLPSEMGDGTPIETMEWFATLDGETYSTASAAAGTEIPVEYKDLANGFHTFGIYVKTGEARSNQKTQNVFVGIDTPAAPANVTLTAAEISWSPVTAGANGGYIDLADLKYEVYLNDRLLTTTTATSAPVNIKEQEFSVFQASVKAVSGDKSSEAGLSNRLLDGKAMSLPVSLAPTPEQYELMAQLDANGDGRGWSYSKYYGCPVTTFSRNGQPMDDWLFLPAINFDSTDKYYTFGMTGSNMGIDYLNEYAEVVAFYEKPDPTAPSATVLEKFQIGAEAQHIAHFRVTAPGTWYIGIHCVSDADQYGIIVKDINVRDEHIMAGSPAAVTDLSATAHENGVLKATASFTFPTKTFMGEDLDADAELVATVKGETTTTVTGKPGAPTSAVVETHQGDNVISVSIAQGEYGSPEATFSVYTGVDTPQRVMAMSMAVAPDMMSAELYWDAPTQGFNGGYINPDLVTYEVYIEVYSAFGSGWQKLADCGTTRTYTYVVPEGSPMQTVTLGVLAINEAGDCGKITYRENLLGTPYTLPIKENFEEPEELTYNPWLIYEGDDGVSYGWGELQLINPDVFADNSKSALYGRSTVAGTHGIIGVPRFSTKDVKAVSLSVDSYAGQYAANTTLTAEYDGLDKPIELGILPVEGDEFRTSTYELPDELMGKEWVQIYLESQFAEATSMMLVTNVEVLDETSGSIAINAGVASVRGEKGGIRILGHNGESAAVVSVDGKTVAEFTCSDSTFVPREPGLYIVRTDSDITKVIVK